jgi:hypothetical protein
MDGGNNCRSCAKMPVAYAEVEDKVIDLLRKCSGKKQILLEHRVNGDLGIAGWDSIYILEELEESFDLDLDPLIQSVTSYLPRTWWDRILRKAHGPRVADLKVQELIAYVVEHAGEGRNESRPRFS